MNEITLHRWPSNISNLRCSISELSLMTAEIHSDIFEMIKNTVAETADNLKVTTRSGIYTLSENIW